MLFTDQSIDQITNIRDFLLEHGVRTSNILKTSANAYIVVVGQHHAIKKVLRSMLPYLCKKGIEARAVIDCYEDRITGNELLKMFQGEVEVWRREKRPRKPIDVPFVYSEGTFLMKEVRKSRLRDAFGRFRAKVTPEDFVMRKKYFDLNVKLQELITEYPEYSKETIRRILGRGRGYIGVKGIGRVDTTDTTLREPKPALK